jgi:hypothetical protein
MNLALREAVLPRDMPPIDLIVTIEPLPFTLKNALPATWLSMG